ncbi:hypothetical protein RV10_GL001166 [Enterococcus pallens]|nr:hypothetical protein RV10_GL001166 [Enterococcus pallens]
MVMHRKRKETGSNEENRKYVDQCIHMIGAPFYADPMFV